MSAPDRINLVWRKSTHSDGAGGCVEVALPATGMERDTHCLIRDSKNPELGTLSLTARQWSDLVNEIRSRQD